MSVAELEAYFAEREARTGERLKMLSAFPGGPDVTPDEVASEVLRVMRGIESGDIEVVDGPPDSGMEKIDVREFLARFAAQPGELAALRAEVAKMKEKG